MKKYLIDICLAIQNGPKLFPEALQTRHPGKSNSARWVTTANSILRLYAQETNPSVPHQRLVGFVLNVYAPAFFHIKINCDVTDGAKNFYLCLELARSYLTPEEQKNVGPVFSNNYFCHPENILLAALRDPHMKNREKAVKYIINARTRASDSIRSFSLPKLNFHAYSHLSMIDFESNPLYITEPPLTFNYTNREMLRFAAHEVLPKCGIPCHSQNVERHVADTTQAAKFASSHYKRHQKLLQTKQSTKEIPTELSQKHFLT